MFDEWNDADALNDLAYRDEEIEEVQAEDEEEEESLAEEPVLADSLPASNEEDWAAGVVIPLLTSAEPLAPTPTLRVARPSIDPTDIYLGQIGASPLLSREEEIHYSRLSKKGCEASRRRMIESNLRLVVKIARRYIRSGMPILDLIEEGNIGLMRAVEKFDPERGFRFSTYGAWWIQQTIERAIMNQANTIRLPVHVAKELNSFLRAKRELAKKLDHEPTLKELAEHLNKPQSDIERILSLNEKTISVDCPVSSEIDKPLLDTLSDNEDPDPAENCEAIEVKKLVSDVLKKLSEKQRDVIIRRFGLLGHEPATLDQTGEDIGLTRERVRQIQSEAMKHLKHALKEVGVEAVGS